MSSCTGELVRGRRFKCSHSEPIPAPRNGGDRLRAQHLAQRRDLDLEIVVFHHQAGPHDVHQLFVGDDAIAARHQSDEEIEGAASQRDDSAVDMQATLVSADVEPSELAAPPTSWRCHSWQHSPHAMRSHAMRDRWSANPLDHCRANACNAVIVAANSAASASTA